MPTPHPTSIFTSTSTPHTSTNSPSTPTPHTSTTSTTTPTPETSTTSTSTSTPHRITTSTSTPTPHTTSTSTPTPHTNTTSTSTPTPHTSTTSTSTSTPHGSTTSTSTPTLHTTSTSTPTPHTNTTSTSTPTPHTSTTSTPTPHTTSTSTPTPHPNTTSTSTPTPHTSTTSTSTPTPYTSTNSPSTPTPHTTTTSISTPTPHPTSISTSTSTPHISTNSPSTPTPHTSTTSTSTPKLHTSTASTYTPTPHTSTTSTSTSTPHTSTTSNSTQTPLSSTTSTSTPTPHTTTTSTSTPSPHTSTTSTSTPTPHSTTTSTSTSTPTPHTTTTSISTPTLHSSTTSPSTPTPYTSTTSTPTPHTTSTPTPHINTNSPSTPTPHPTSISTPTPHSHTTSTPIPHTNIISTSTSAATPHISTTSTPTPHTSTTSVPGPTLTSPHETTDCRAQCSWTLWFDVDSPEPGSHGGDLETYDHILQRGHNICRRPEEITRLQCRAQSHPEVPIAALGQVVQCDRDTGLVCHNRDQQGAAGQCLDYEVRVLCCRVPDGCPSTAVPATTETSSSAPSSTMPSAAPATSCFCHVVGQLYPAGSVIYHQTDLDGHCYYALCSWDCHVVRGVDATCPTPTTALPTSTHSSRSHCLHVVPQRKKGETWATHNCSQATCEGDNVISLSPRPCPELTPPFCANGYPALKVADADGCCQHYQCQCVCSGWGDPHYITFDGTYYTFLDNCTYVLVQQIVPVFGHFRVLVDNDFCDAEDMVSCPQSIIVEYHGDRVVLTRRPVRGAMTNQILFNGEVVSPGFQKNGIAVSRMGIKMYVTIRELGVQVMFSGLIFSVEVPFSTFANNTEGQCGTCTNNKKDECRMPGGALATSCSEMSTHWRVDTPDQPFCGGPLPTPTPGQSVPTSAVPACSAPPICQLILTKVFEPCYAMIDPMPFFEGCVFDYCHKTELEVVCSSLELYASLCAAQGTCVDWRSWTNDSCPFPCPEDKVYKPCGPSDPPYCYQSDNASNPALPKAGRITEGCFCPGTLKLFSTNAPVCVPENCSSCLGHHGEPIQPGQITSKDCQECVCDPDTKSLTCHQKACPLPPACRMPGFMSVAMTPKEGQCCPQYTCVCNSSYCPEPQDCPKGSRLTLTHEEGACCPSQSCSWTNCSINGTLYQPGAVVFSSLCETCRCEVPSGPTSDGFMVSCETQICNTHCPMGFEYQLQEGQCCGQCVQKTCVISANATGHPVHLLLPGESWSDPGAPCVNYVCEHYEDRLEVTVVKKECPTLDCTRAQAELSPDGCCLLCPSRPTVPVQKWPCTLRHREQVLWHQNCSSAVPVNLTYCEGTCGDSTSRYSVEAIAMEHKCHCCQERRTSPRTVTLHCADGSNQAFSYTQVEECGCQDLKCQMPGSQEAESGESWEQGPRPLQ